MSHTRFAMGAIVAVFISALGWSTLAAQDKAATSQRTPSEPMHGEGVLFVKYEDAGFQKIIPELGDDGPEIAMLRVDPETGATQLLIRSVAPMRVPEHWHSANETHTVIKGTQVYECGGKRVMLGPGGFNYIPAKDPHRAWLSADAVVFITVDGPWDINWVTSPPKRQDLGPAAIEDVIENPSDE